MIVFSQIGEKVRMSVISDKKSERTDDNSIPSPVNRDYEAESLARSKRRIYELVNCNYWTSFVTFTLRDDIASHNDDWVVQYVSRALTDFHRLYPFVRFMLVLERHESGHLHFHGFSNVPLDKRFGIRYRGNYKAKNGRWYSRYVCDFFLKRLGGNVFSPIKCNKSTLYRYCVKYMTKSLSSDLPRRYMASRGLHGKIRLPIRTYFSDRFYELFCKYSYKVFESNYCWVYEMDKYVFDQIYRVKWRRSQCLPKKPASYACQMTMDML